MLIHSQIHSDFQLPHVSPTFNPLAQTYDPIPISNYIWNTSNLLLLSSDVEINSGPRPIDQNPVFCSISSNKINYGIQEDIAPTWSDKIVTQVVIKLTMVYPSTKLAMEKILVSPSPGNAVNVALVSPRLLSHLLRFMSFQVDLLLLGNLASFVKVLFAPDMLT